MFKQTLRSRFTLSRAWGRTIRKVMGGNQNKTSSKGKCPEKNSCKRRARYFTKKPEWFPQCARDFSRAVSGFCQVFLVTRAKSVFFSRLRDRPLADTVWADTEDSRSTREKNFWYLRYQNDHIFWCEGKILSLN